MLKSCLSAHVLSNLDYCAPVWILSAESDLSLLNPVVRSGEMLCEGGLCFPGTERRSVPCVFFYEIYDRADDLLHEYLHHFVTARNTRVSAALCELVLVIPRCRTEQFSLSFLPVAARLWNMLPSNIFRGSTIIFFRSKMNLYLQRPLLIFLSLYFGLLLLF